MGHYTSADIPGLPDDWYISKRETDYGCFWVRENGDERRPTHAEAKAIHAAINRYRVEVLGLPREWVYGKEAV